jgi:hypothetical protein
VATDPSGTDPTQPFVVDGEPARLGLAALDPEHAVLVEATDDGLVRSRVVLGREARRERDGAMTREIVIDGWRVEVELESERRASLRERARRASDVSGRSGPVEVHAIIPGGNAMAITFLGIVEILLACAVAFKPRVGGDLSAAYLVLAALSVFTIGGMVVLGTMFLAAAVCALAMARLSTTHR